MAIATIGSAESPTRNEVLVDSSDRTGVRSFSFNNSHPTELDLHDSVALYQEIETKIRVYLSPEDVLPNDRVNMIVTKQLALSSITKVLARLAHLPAEESPFPNDSEFVMGDHWYLHDETGLYMDVATYGMDLDYRTLATYRLTGEPGETIPNPVRHRFADSEKWLTFGTDVMQLIDFYAPPVIPWPAPIEEPAVVAGS
jgi:hypothetical protein